MPIHCHNRVFLILQVGGSPGSMMARLLRITREHDGKTDLQEGIGEAGVGVFVILLRHSPLPRHHDHQVRVILVDVTDWEKLPSSLSAILRPSNC